MAKSTGFLLLSAAAAALIFFAATTSAQQSTPSTGDTLVQSCGGCNFYVSPNGTLWRGCVAKYNLQNCFGTLDLSSRNITRLLPGTFNDIGNGISLSNNQISSIPPGVFTNRLDDGFPLFLDISRNMITSFPIDLCKGLFNIGSISLAHNRISSLSRDTFNHCWSISILDISNNNISTLEAFAFEGLKNLKKLYLHNNNISQIHPDVFRGLFQLIVLSLGGNDELKCFSFFTPGLYIIKDFGNEDKSLPSCTYNEPSSSPNFLQSNVARFNYPECAEKRSWEMLANFYKGYPEYMSTGDLGALADGNYKTWVCFQWHPCTIKLGALSGNDAMCYVYNENDKTWFPWGLKSEIEMCE